MTVQYEIAHEESAVSQSSIYTFFFSHIIIITMSYTYIYIYMVYSIWVWEAAVAAAGAGCTIQHVYLSECTANCRSNGRRHRVSIKIFDLAASPYNCSIANAWQSHFRKVTKLQASGTAFVFDVSETWLQSFADILATSGGARHKCILRILCASSRIKYTYGDICMYLYTKW